MYQLNVGKVYKFNFKNIIESQNAIYRLMNIMTLDDIIDSKIDLYNDNFKNMNVSEDDYNNEILNNLQDSIILKLQKIDDISIVYYIPEFLLVGQPIVNVSPYLRLGLAVNLGIFNDINKLDNIKNEINDILKTQVGISSSAIIFSSEEIWMTDEDYKNIEDIRKNNIDQLSSIYKDNVDLKKQILQLQNIIKTYEELIIDLQN